MPGNELPWPWDLSGVWVHVDSVPSVLVVLRGSHPGSLPPGPRLDPPKPNAPLRKGPSDRAWTSMWRFYSWGLGALSVMETEKGKFEHVKTQDQRNQVTKHLREHLLRLALQERWINSWCLSPHRLPSPGAVFSSFHSQCVWESGYWHLFMFKPRSVFVGE